MPHSFLSQKPILIFPFETGEPVGQGGLQPLESALRNIDVYSSNDIFKAMRENPIHFRPRHEALCPILRVPGEGWD